MRVAIIGTGISGLVAAHLLQKRHEVVVFEANNYAGGHTNTVRIELKEGSYAVDTGFIVFNEQTYPNFLKLIRSLNVAYKPTEMSFSVRCEITGLEYRPTISSLLFGQPRNLLRPSFYKMASEIFRFRRESEQFLRKSHESITLGMYLSEKRYSPLFVDKFLIPIGAAIWSADPERFKEFPLKSFSQFFRNHGILYPWNQPQWFVIDGGSQRYVEKLTQSFRDRIRLNCAVDFIQRHPDHVLVKSGGLESERFDSVVIATHSDQALRMLSDPSDEESEILSAIPYQENVTLLHSDDSILPKRRVSWASWNVLIPRTEAGRPFLTYNMSILQQIKAPVQFCVSLNLERFIDPGKVFKNILYHHPVFNSSGFGAQARWPEINGVNRTYYCGAYWGYGFHEDGVKSGLEVAKRFGEAL